jgi:hypothetical protein
MTFIDRTNSSALQKKSRAVQENLHVQKFQRQLDVNHSIPHCSKGCFTTNDNDMKLMSEMYSLAQYSLLQHIKNDIDSTDVVDNDYS